MEKYAGTIPVPQDETNFDAALTGLLNYVEKTFNVNLVTESAAEKEELQTSIQISLQRLKVPLTKVHRMTVNDYDLECLIGYGSFGNIWKAESEKFGVIALKQLKVDLTELTNLWNERDLMVLLKHKRICNLIAAFYDKDVYFVLELCHGSVAHLCPRISKQNAVRFSVQLLQAVEWIHSHKVVHADIKPDNCLINTTNNLVLSDFGSAVHLGNSRTSVTFVVPHGSPGYMDFRANKFLEFSAATDIFSAACVIFELNTKSTLLFYQDQQDQTREMYVEAFEKGRVMKMGRNDQNNDSAREPLVDRAMRCNFGYLLKKMIADENRLTAAQALEDAAMRGVLLDAKVYLETIDTCAASKFVTREFTQDYSYVFDNISVPATPELDLALLTFEYTQKESSVSSNAPDEVTSSDEEVRPVTISSKKKKKAKHAKRHHKKVKIESSSVDDSSSTNSSSD